MSRRGKGALRRVADRVRAARVVAASGVLEVSRPDRAVRAAADLRAYGPVAGALRVAVRRHGARTALIDADRSVTFAALDARSDRVAAALQDAGHAAGVTVAVLCRDHCAMVEAMMGATKAGAGLVLMNTGMSPAEVRAVCGREGIGLLIHDAEFAATAAGVDAARIVVGGSDDEFEPLIARGARLPAPVRPRRPGPLVVLTGGTTGIPKGAPRTVRSPLVAAQFLDRIPLPFRGTTLVCASPVPRHRSQSVPVVGGAGHHQRPGATLRSAADPRAHRGAPVHHRGPGPHHARPTPRPRARRAGPS